MSVLVGAEQGFDVSFKYSDTSAGLYLAHVQGMLLCRTLFVSNGVFSERSLYHSILR